VTTLLIVDDLAENCYLLETLFQSLGYRTVSASDGAAALELIRRAPPDLVISDILMPVMDGFEFCRRLKLDEQLKSIPFIIYTATYTEPEDERLALGLGADRFLSKPQEPATLSAIVRELLDHGPAPQESALAGPLGSELDFLRQHSDTLFQKLGKKVQDLQQLSDLHLLLYQVNLAMRSARSEAELFRQACSLCTGRGRFDLAWIGWAPVPDRPLRPDFVAGPLAGYAQGLEIPLDPAFPEAHGPSAVALREERVVVCQDRLADPPTEPWNRQAALHGIRSSAALPVSMEGGPVAVLNLYSALPGFFTQDRLDLLEELAKDLSYAILSLAQTRRREEAEERFRRLNADLEQRVAERTVELESANKELATFAYSVSHDLRAPLRHMDGFLTLLAEHLGDRLDQEGAHFLGVAQAANARMVQLVEALLSFSRLGRAELHVEEIAANPMLDSVIEDFRGEWAARKVQWRVAQLPPLRCDPTLARLVFQNLVSNALKFTRGRAEAVIQIQPIEGLTGETGIVIRDNGAGFDPAYQSRLFGVFQRLHRQDEFEGTGIGLANVQRIVSRHGGRVWAEGAPNRGAAFFIAFPGKPAPESAPS
jgi:signal transduction histidine kinase/DNA-binding response OmpR family regulator